MAAPLPAFRPIRFIYGQRHIGSLAMLIGRSLMIVPMLAVAGSLVTKKIVPPSSGTFPTDGPLFVGLVVGVILIMGGLTYFPALSLRPHRRAFRRCSRGASYCRLAS